jgi:hypothetical protein
VLVAEVTFGPHIRSPSGAAVKFAGYSHFTDTAVIANCELS